MMEITSLSDAFLPLIGLAGFLVFAVIAGPLVSTRTPFSPPALMVAIGAVSACLLGDAFEPDLTLDHQIVERLAELILIVSLGGAGLRIDDDFSIRRWAPTWRLLAITLPLSIVGGYVVGSELLGLGVASALLVGAALAPTDPVLAADVQVGPPRAGPGGRARFALTSEAGLNDGVGLPFTLLAIAFAGYGEWRTDWVVDWLVVQFLWQIVGGTVVGVLLGRLFGYLIFHDSRMISLASTRNGFAALGVILVAYATAQFLQTNGFICVFVTAYVIRRHERERLKGYVDDLHIFADRVERFLMMALLFVFGGALQVGMLEGLQWSHALTAILLVFVVRPVCGLLGFISSPMMLREKVITSFFGIRGIGSLYYVAYAVGEAEFGDAADIWLVVTFAILLSVVIHGALAPHGMKWLDRRNPAGASRYVER